MANTIVSARDWGASTSLVWKITGMLSFTLLAILSAQVRIPIPFTPIPMTLQTLVVPLAGAFLGSAWGVASILLYCVLGLFGLQVFAAAPTGLAMLAGPTAGYLVGFVLSAWIMGVTRSRRFRPALMPAALVLAHWTIFGCGIIGLMINTGSTLKTAFALGVIPFLLGDTLKIAVSFFVLLPYWVNRK